jgi:hypothetical protein
MYVTGVTGVTLVTPPPPPQKKNTHTHTHNMPESSNEPIFGNSIAGWSVLAAVITVSEVLLVVWLSGAIGNRLECSNCTIKGQATKAEEAEEE